MTRGFTHVRVGHVGHHGKRSTCTNGGFINPANGATVDTSQPVNVTWQTTCLNTSAVDIYLIAPGAANTRIHLWQNVNYNLGYYEATLNSSWWNSSDTANLQLSMVATGSETFLSPLSAGPVFSGVGKLESTNESSSGNSDSPITKVSNFVKEHLAAGKVAVAILFPILLVGLCVTVYMKIMRKRNMEKRKRWSEAVDKRMSTISTDWKSMSPAGATAAIRHSMAVSGSSGNRNSAFSFGNIRPDSIAATEGGGQAGIGARGLGIAGANGEQPYMSQLRPNIRSSAFGERQSRVSFAVDVRPSLESRRSAAVSRAYHTGFAPPLPERQDSNDFPSDQKTGPRPLSTADISINSVNEHVSRLSAEEFAPAISMMYETESPDRMSLSPQDLQDMPLPPTPSHAAPASPVISMLPMPMEPASVMSPDDMLRAYAERKAKTMSGGVNAGISYPAPALTYDGNGMRTLYSPTTPGPTPTTSSHLLDGDRPHSSVVVVEGDDDSEDAYGGTH